MTLNSDLKNSFSMQQVDENYPDLTTRLFVSCWRKKIFFAVQSLFIIFFFCLHNCKTPEIKEKAEIVEYDTPGDGKSYYAPVDKRNKDFLEFVRQLEEKVSSFYGEFTMKIVVPKEQDTILNGKVYYEKDGKKLKIQILDPFFGLILTQIISNPTNIKIKQGGNDNIYEQKMGDIQIIDPAKGKKFIIPFPVIFYSIALDFLGEFTSKESLLNPVEKKVKVRRGTDEFTYIFYPEGLESLEVLSTMKNLQAKAKVADTARKGIHPPERILTRVSEPSSGKNLSQVDLQFKSVKRQVRIPDREFKF